MYFDLQDCVFADSEHGYHVGYGLSVIPFILRTSLLHKINFPLVVCLPTNKSDCLWITHCALQVLMIFLIDVSQVIGGGGGGGGHVPPVPPWFLHL